MLHVFGSAVMPSSVYRVETIALSCQGLESSCAAVSAPFEVATGRWGDIETPYNPPSAVVQPDVADISALVNKFKSAPGAPIKARALIAGADRFGNVGILPDFDFSHIAAAIDAFQGKAYPYSIATCP